MGSRYTGGVGVGLSQGIETIEVQVIYLVVTSPLLTSHVLTWLRITISCCSRAELRPNILLHHSPTRPPRLYLRLIQLPQLIHLWRTSRNNPLRHIHRPSGNILPHNCINRRLHLNPYNANPRILRPATMFPVS